MPLPSGGTEPLRFALVGTPSVREALRAHKSPVSIADFDPRGTPLAPGGKSATRKTFEGDAARLATLQEALFAEGIGGGNRRLLLILQGMDTSGKDGVIKHVIGAMNPQGCQITAFKKPTPEEAAHHFLWRVRRAVPRPGMVGIFNRSQYEDVLVVRVHQLVPVTTWEKRYGEINHFESKLADEGVHVVKCFLNISKEEQRERLLVRLDTPEKRWKFNPSDVDERQLWPAYTKAYEAMLERTNTENAPWYVVPSDRKWYRNWAIGQLLLETLEELSPRFPEPDYDVELQRRRLTDEE